MADEINTQVRGLVGEAGPLAIGATPFQRAGRQGDVISSNLHGRFTEMTLNRRVFHARAIVTAPVIFSTAAGTGGPLLWNPPGSGVLVALLKATVGVTVVTTVAAALGITGGTGQAVAPTSTTAIDTQTNGYIGGAAPQAQAFRVGTPAAAGTFFMPFCHVHTGALTVDTTGLQAFDIDGSIILPENSWASIAASATASTLVAQLGLTWEEIPTR